jgi:hypothetical protein
VEQEEQRPLDHYDLVSVLYLAQQNRTDQVLSRYVPQEILNEGTPEEQVARFNSQAGDYRVELLFQRISNDVPRNIPQRGNVSSSTMHQVVRRLFAGHVLELTAKELADKGITITPEEMAGEFNLARILNDNCLEMQFKR